MAALNNTLYYLERSPNRAAFNLATLQRGNDKGALVFQEVALASEHLKNLPKEVAVRTLDDERTKEEFLRAALQRGATQLWFDVDAQSLEPRAVQPLAEALFYILSFKREAACL